MSKAQIQAKFADSQQLRQFLKKASTNAEATKFHLHNIWGSALSFFFAEAYKKSDNTFLLICNDKEEAAYHLNDLESFLEEKNVLFYPGSYRRAYHPEAISGEETDNANVLLRSEVLNRINSRKKPSVIVTYPEALFEKVVTKKELNQSILKLKIEDELSIDFVNEVLFEYHFKRVDFVTEPGEFSVRGGIIDVFSYANDEPYRIEFFGDEVESIRTFDVETQLSKEQKKKISIMPNMENKQHTELRQSFLDYIPSETLVFVKSLDLLCGQLTRLFTKANETFQTLSKEVNHANPEALFLNEEEIKKQLQGMQVVEFGTGHFFKAEEVIRFATEPQPSFNKQFNLLIDHLNQYHQKGFTNYIACVSQQQAKRFKDIFEDMETQVAYQPIVLPIHQGFIDQELKILVYTDHQIFDRYHKFQLKSGYAKKEAITLKELTSLEVGDYVTHIDHGIGKFGGLQKIDVEGKKQEAIKLVYGERDILYLSIHSLHKISKYNGKDGKPPKIYKLGSKAWKSLKQKTKTKVKKIAFDLIQLYAKRRLEEGFQFAPDSYLQHELEASFIYEDTPDQSSATEAVKKDMESPQPMDRLVCGDVGFGKTEVAIRAAFKAVDNGKQVAVLVPTTILAFQHHQSFTERLKDLPVSVDYLNRFRTAKERRQVLEELENGRIDIVIGTHQLVNKNIKFKDLGLLIIDEEQKFGVAVKDKLKTIKANVDTLTLTATPIPRTLQFSLMAARDLSTITTPPPNRYPIETHVVRFNEELIRDAVTYEIQRGGQVFFINNRIENINEVAGMIQRLVPDAKVGIGHGQMEGKKLEKLMLSFINNEFDVLVATTIIESGLDVTNANTIFINNANNFGVSDLHQMRGRVGRSNKKAFCYLITPHPTLMTVDARKRINALEQFSELGSGFKIAMKDLEIRGAGDLLGGEQSGFINDIGFDTYQKILNEAIDELKENEFKELYQEENQNEEKVFVKDAQIDTDFEILFPDDYINNITERLNLYTKLNQLKNEEELQAFENELKDRFGDLPIQVIDLLNSLRIKWIAASIGLEKIVMKQAKMIGYFIADQHSGFYQSKRFSEVLQTVQQHPHVCRMKEKQTRNGLRLLLVFDQVKNLATGLERLQIFEATEEAR
ncbi:transcription-repair coupling factor [Psychroflexus maritimus]|uniref:Transcription-repair-coupling factor n=1 Tax=Psychroflexus maritimus TaxID=2714865 RepID=A0A967E017_9FLAO|nr:transcription-repair coupling factor [Psychroflexus maritimus]NGZ90798.1 transcription-repair coupling factor [Psychroflexus maritimus]